jgi:hypothetical protein
MYTLSSRLFKSAYICLSFSLFRSLLGFVSEKSSFHSGGNVSSSFSRKSKNCSAVRAVDCASIFISSISISGTIKVPETGSVSMSTGIVDLTGLKKISAC